MKRRAQIGWVCAFVGLFAFAPAVARADSIGVMSAVYEASFLRFAPEHEEAPMANAPVTLFSLCRRCAAPDAAPFLVSTNLSSVPSSTEGGGFNVVFNGGFAATFGGVTTVPVPALSSTASPAATTPSVSLPATSSSDGGRGDPPAMSGGGSGSGQAINGVLKPADPAGGGVTSTGHATLLKAESLAATPEPATLLLLGTGLVGIAGRRVWRRRI